MAGSVPRVSVVMPTYNASPHVEHAIESILAQTYADLEVIVVDDGSDDGTMAILDSFEDDRIRVMERPNESGIASARNDGIAAARGEYVAQHDADDWSFPGRIRRQVEFLDENPDVALVGTGARLVDESGNKIGRRRVLECPTLSDLIDENQYVHGSVMARTDALEVVGGYEESFPSAEDYDLYLRLAEKNDVANIDESLYALRIHDESTYATDLAKKRLYHYLAIQRSESRAPDVDELQAEELQNAVYERMTDERRFAYHLEVARDLLRYSDLKGSREHSKRASEIRSRRILPYFLLALSYSKPTVTTIVARTYRTFVVNPRLRLENHKCPTQRE